MANVKDDAVTLGNGTVVEGGGLHDLEQVVTAAAGVGDSREERVLDCYIGASQHKSLPDIRWSGRGKVAELLRDASCQVKSSRCNLRCITSTPLRTSLSAGIQPQSARSVRG